MQKCRRSVRYALTVVCLLPPATFVSGCDWMLSTSRGLAVHYQDTPVMTQRSQGAQAAQGSPPVSQAAQPGAYPPPFDLDSDTFSECAGPAPPSSCKPAYALAAGSDSAAQAARNRLQDVLMRRSDAICIVKKSRIASLSDEANFSLGELTTVLGGAGAIVTGATAARVLAGLAGITSATRAQVNEVYYQNALKTAILGSIDDLRAKKKISLVSSKSSSISDYSVDAMLLDVNEYNEDCSFIAGITNLQRATNTVANSVDILTGRLAAARARLDIDNAALATAQKNASSACTGKNDSDRICKGARDQVAIAQASVNADLSSIKEISIEISIAPGAASGVPAATSTDTGVGGAGGAGAAGAAGAGAGGAGGAGAAGAAGAGGGSPPAKPKAPQ